MGKEDYVQTGVILLCDKGVIPTPLIATPKMQNHHGITGATIRDNIPLLNILPFGLCSVTRAPCLPVMPTWENYPTSPYFIEGFQPLVLSSEAICKLGGTIKIYTSYQEIPATGKWKDAAEKILSKSLGTTILGPILGNTLDALGMGDFVEGVGKGFVKGIKSTFEGLYNMVRHPIDTLGGVAKLAGVAVVGYSSPIPGVTPEQRLSMFDAKFGTNLSEVNDGIKQSLADTGDTLLHGTNEQRGEIVGQAIEFVAEAVVGTKGVGAALKSVEAGSLGAKAAKVAGTVNDVIEATKTVGGKLQEGLLEKLPKPIKGVFGKGAEEVEKVFDFNKYKLKEGEKLGDFGENVAKDYYRSKGYDKFYEVQNPSGNGVDIVAQNSKNGDMVKVEVKTTQQDKFWNNGETKEIPMSKDQKAGGETYTNDRLNRAAKGDDGYTDGISSEQAQAALKAQDEALFNGSEIRTEKLDIYVDKGGSLHSDPVPRKW